MTLDLFHWLMCMLGWRGTIPLACPKIKTIDSAQPRNCSIITRPFPCERLGLGMRQWGMAMARRHLHSKWCLYSLDQWTGTRVDWTRLDWSDLSFYSSQLCWNTCTANLNSWLCHWWKSKYTEPEMISYIQQTLWRKALLWACISDSTTVLQLPLSISPLSQIWDLTRYVHIEAY